MRKQNPGAPAARGRLTLFQTAPDEIAVEIDRDDRMRAGKRRLQTSIPGDGEQQPGKVARGSDLSPAKSSKNG